MKELQLIKKIGLKNSLKIKGISQRMNDDDEEARSFQFPLRTEEQHKTFEACCLKKVYAEKLVSNR